nr:RNA-directed DNA polymerase, eukaryota [Tanacetum cinerariifolium]
KKKKKGKSKSTNGGQIGGHSVKQNIKYEPNATTSAPKKGATNLDQGGVNDEILLSRMDLLKQMQDIKSSDARDCVMVDGEWMDDPSRVKEESRSHFATRFQAPGVNRSRLIFRFPNRLNPDQIAELENPITIDEIHNAVWACGENKSPGPDRFTFEFFRKFWNIIGSDLCVAIKWFFDHSSFTKGCNSSFVALISKTHDPKQEGNGSFGIKDLCFRQELLEYMGVHDNDASESSKPSWGKMCTSGT